MELIDKLIFHKNDPVFDAAKDLFEQWKEKIKNGTGDIAIRLPSDKWIKIIEGDSRSPEMQCFKDGKLILLRFPKNSTPYSDHITSKVKDCTIIDGILYDENKPGITYVPGERFKVFPSQDVRPYTKNSSVLAVVKILE